MNFEEPFALNESVYDYYVNYDFIEDYDAESLDYLDNFKDIDSTDFLVWWNSFTSGNNPYKRLYIEYNHDVCVEEFCNCKYSKNDIDFLIKLYLKHK